MRCNSGRGLTLVFVGLLLMTFAACSSGSKSATSNAATATTLTLSKAAYISRANALCRTMNARIAALGDPGSDRLKLAQKTDRAVAITAATLRQLRDLPVPAGQAATLSAIYAKVD